MSDNSEQYIRFLFQKNDSFGYIGYQIMCIVSFVKKAEAYVTKFKNQFTKYWMNDPNYHGLRNHFWNKKEKYYSLSLNEDENYTMFVVDLIKLFANDPSELKEMDECRGEVLDYFNDHIEHNFEWNNNKIVIKFKL
jgi:hypothetical protein